MAYALEGAAGLAAAETDYRRALTLLGSAAALREAVGIPLPSRDQETIDRHRAALAELLTTEEYDEAWAAGSALPFEDALDLALPGNGRTNPPSQGTP